jgi:heat shock protein HslJ
MVMGRAGLLVGLFCCACSAPNDEDGGGLQAALLDRAFVSESVEGWQLVSGTEVRMNFGGQELSADAGCNKINATYTIAGSSLTTTGSGMTLMGCDKALHAQDDWLLGFLHAGPRLELVEPRLVMSTKDAKMTLLDREVASPDLPLVGTLWKGDGFSDGSVATGPAPPGLSIFFRPDASVTINTSCQTGTGTYQVAGSVITFQALSYDGAACPDPSYQSSSDRVLAVLDGSAVDFQIEEKRLAIQRGNNTVYFRGG